MNYKLIKIYPGSPELGYITKFDDKDEDWSIPNMLIIPDCKDYPEFWEKIKEEKTFEIIEIGHTNGIFTYNALNPKEKHYIDNFLKTKNNSYWSISRVKRLSDNEIFSIGDDVILKGASPNFEKGKIKFFQLGKNDNLRIDTGGYNVNISFIEKAKTPLFITFDNVEIFEDCIVYGLFPDSWERFGQKCSTISSLSKLQYFSSVEALNNYVDENKPLYSKKNMINFGKQMFTRGVKNDYSCEAEVVLSMFKK